MRIFLTGGAGYIGSVCSELLLNEGHEVAIFDNLSEGHRRAVDSRANFIRGDLADRLQIEAALSSTRPDAVMHFAAYALVPESMHDPSKYFRNNIANGLNLLDVSSYWQTAVIGVVIVMAVWIDVVRQRSGGKKARRA